jgi:hypothetical protein
MPVKFEIVLVFRVSYYSLFHLLMDQINIACLKYGDKRLHEFLSVD